MNSHEVNLHRQINASPILNALNPEEKTVLLALATNVRFAKGHTIFEQSDPGDEMYIIITGQVGLSTLDLTGKELTLAMIGPGDFFGEMAVLDNGGRSTYATALTEVTVGAISRRCFREMIAIQPQIAMKIITTLCQRLRATNTLLQEMAFGSVKERLKHQLAVDDHEEKVIRLNLTHQKLAAKIGASRETVTRVLKELRDEGWEIRKTTSKK